MPEKFHVGKIANVGRWPLAAYLTVGFLVGQWQNASWAMEFARSAPVAPHMLIAIASELFLLCLWFAVVRGVLTWANWVHALLVSAYALALIGLVLRFPRGISHAWGRLWVLDFALGCVAFLWLLLPSVRTEYWRREHVA